MIGELYPGEFDAMEHNGRMDALQQESCEDWCDVPSDEMTLEQARQAVKDLRKKLTEYLEQEPCDVFDKYGNYKYPSDVELTEPNTATSMPCEDAISRQAIIDAMSDTWKHICFVARRRKPKKGEEAVYSDMVGTVKSIPPVKPQPNTGHWIFDEILYKHYYCSECKSMGVDYWDFCPYCGAKMIEPQESEDTK